MSLSEEGWYTNKFIDVVLGMMRVPIPHEDEDLKWNRAVWVHVYEKKDGFQNDIAILSMLETVEFGPKIRPICLPDDDIQV